MTYRPGGPDVKLAAAAAICVTAVLICVTCVLLLSSGVSPQRTSAVSPGQRLDRQVNDTAAVQPAAGKGGTASVDGNDAVGQVNITTGSGPAAGSLVHITFRAPYPTQPFVVVSPEDQPPPDGWYVTIDQDGWDIVVGSAPKPGTNYPFAYIIEPRPWLMYPGSK